MDQPKSNSNSLESVCSDPSGLQLQIYDWIVRGESEAAITDALGQHLDADQIRGVIGRVYTQFFELMQGDATALHGWTLAAAQDVYKRMYNIGDYSGCLKAIKEIRAIAERMEKAAPGDAPRLNGGDDVPAADALPAADGDNLDEIPSLDLSTC